VNFSWSAFCVKRRVAFIFYQHDTPRGQEGHRGGSGLQALEAEAAIGKTGGVHLRYRGIAQFFDH